MNHAPPPARLGFLYPGHAAEDDYPLMGSMVQPPAEVTLIHTEFLEDAHTVEALSEMGSVGRLSQGAEALAGSEIESVMWTSTSASFVLGLEGIRQQIDALEKLLGVPASTTAMAFARAVKTIDAKRVAIAATYPKDVAQRFREFLQHFDIEVVHLASRGIITAAEVGTLGKDEVINFALANTREDADALLIPDTALHSAAWLTDLEQATGKPVLTANQVSFWEALRLCGKLTPQSGLGHLFEEAP
ncbi:maleate cis-trans isomerase family protein [Marinobacter subterrani]|uniref:Maleate cis-trans isomerase n=1 Tax=Marinobacter subterrani TaxID=1658765 RepID=A0A0J7JBR4_9GAMM|nr:maleate cis-trans isomerase [Marinobacter subterrani]KMQ75933.1 Maleate cis-trans isomerase [Marinobacter subterrani]